MKRRRGSWPPLLLGVATFLLAFVWLRSRSTFLAAEAEPAVARQLATQHAVDVAEVLALRQLLLERGEDAALAATTAAFAAAKRELGRPLAAMVAFGDEAVRGEVRAVVAEVAAVGGQGVGADAVASASVREEAWRRLRVKPIALAALQFVEVCGRYEVREVVRR